ncbi:hypothetical protein AB870_24640 (plasmid) [Pandoraea faecigallinarum]|uniref:Uncharacterized protein n=1 Tax=Pandoraea faecigallinarum TaxID=656179 RepID=A0A0H3X077_9BURK|nr:hypothetical protein AB870_24640 [Pandoraea faecigallinarum]
MLTMLNEVRRGAPEMSAPDGELDERPMTTMMATLGLCTGQQDFIPQHAIDASGQPLPGGRKCP